jgi:exopolysaccharide biosynthesis protein
MQKLSAFICVHLLTIFLFVSVSAQEFKTVQDGVEYAEMTRGTKEEPVHINLLKLDLTKVRLDVAHAMDAALGLEKTSSIAARYNALAAINAGFFRLDKSIFAGDATGVLMIDSNFWSETYSNRVALLIANKQNRTETYIANLDVSHRVMIRGFHLKVTGINRQRKENDLIIYQPEFSRTSLTDDKGLEILVINNRISRIFKNKGNNIIPRNGYILSASGEWVEELARAVRVKAKAKFGHEPASRTTADLLLKVMTARGDIVGGVPQLIKNGKIEITWQQEKSSKEFVETRHPRTAVARLKDGKFLMVTIDGRQAGYSVGMNLNELAAFLLELGAQDAMNLDGGGSTTMFLDGKVVNKPSDKEGERSVSDAILVFPRKRN